MTLAIAIVGLGGVLPLCPDGRLEAYWEAVQAGRSATRDVPAERWPVAPESVLGGKPGEPDRVYSRRACPIDGFSFQPTGFTLAPEALLPLDPLYHLALTASREALAGVKRGGEAAREAVVLGNLVLPSEGASRLAEQVLGGAAVTAGAPDRHMAGLPGALVARALGLAGGGYTLDAACSSSLYAIALAMEELAAGRKDLMLAGGVSRPDCFYTQMGFGQLRALSASGRCAPFDERGDGLVVGEGAGVVALKRLEDARRDGDTIYAVLRAVGLSNDVDGSLLAPSQEGQLRAMRAAYARAGWDPRSVDLIECHATGTPLGDAVEVGSLKALWGDEGWEAGRCVLGSAKSNVGHLLTAAGAAGLIKVVHALRSRVLPPTANFQSAAPATGMAGSPFRVLSAAEPWPEPADGRPRRAALSAFGFGGINAHVLVEAWEGQAAPAADPVPDVPVAIVGMAARFGGLETLREFQEATLGGDVPERHQLRAPRWRGQAPSRDLDGYYLEHLDLPVGAFRIPPKELDEMLPQQLLALLLAREAALDAGLDLAARKPNVGAMVGIALDAGATDFHVRWVAEPSRRDAFGPPLDANRTVGALGGMVASRVARELRLGGPSFTLSSEETSGLRALEVGLRALQRGELDAAVVGAVDLPGDPRGLIATDALRPSGPSRPLEPGSTGSRVGEGGVMFVLKRLDDALAAGDRVYAVLRGVGASTASAPGAGATPMGIPAPGAYTAAVAQALGDVPLGAVGLLEAHASGAPAEDSYEAAELARLDGGPALGALKAVIGHTGVAAGLAGVARAALSLYQQVLPAAVGPRPLQAAYPGLEGRYHAPRRAQAWLHDRAAGPRRALATAIGVDGACGAVLLEAAPESTAAASPGPTPAAAPLGAMPAALFTLAGDDVPALLGALGRLKALPDAPIEGMARRWWQQEGQAAGTLGLAIVASDAADLRTRLAQAEQHLRTSPDQPLGEVGPIAYQPRPLGAEASVAYVFPGSGSHYPGMGADLGVRFPELLRAQDRESQRLASLWRLPQIAPQRLTWPAGWEARAEAGLADAHQTLLLAQVSFGALAFDAARRLGPAPAAVIGYCLGETAGMVATRTWADRDELAARMEGTTLFSRDLAGPCEAARKTWACLAHERVTWVMGLVDRPREVVEQALVERSYLLIVNAPGECVIGGDGEAVEAVVAALGCNFHKLEGITSVHCEVVKAVGEAYRELHHHPTTPPAGVRFYSGGWGRAYEVTQDSAADALLAQATQTFDFTRLIEQAYADGIRVFLEVGPRRSCARMVHAILGDRPHLAVSTSARGDDELRPLLTAMARLHADRLPVDLSPLYAGPSPAAALQPPSSAPTLRIPIQKPRPAAPAQPALTSPHIAPAPAPTSVPVAPAPAPVPVASPFAPAHAPVPAAPLAAPAPLPAAPAAARVAPAQAPVTPMKAPRPTATAPATLPPFSGPTQASPRDLPMLPSQLPSGTALAHEAYLALTRRQTAAHMSALTHHTRLLELALGSTPAPKGPAPFMDRAACLEFARGTVGAVLGQAFAEADRYPTRVRLPDEPLMLVDRILTVTGEPRSMTHGTVVTEHDVLPGAWYLDAGRIPTCVAVEAGQADLFLSGYLGIDFETKGLACYRLLDAVVTFHGPLPAVGDVIRYDIAIDRFARQGDTWIFFFHFEATVGDRPIISMQQGCAGFFTPEQLDDGKGIVFTRLDLTPQVGERPSDWRDLAPMQPASYTDAQIDRLRQGDLAGAFGPAFAGLINAPATIPGGKMRLVHRITKLEPGAGRFGLGFIEGEADIFPDDWFLTCHFVDDMVMPGTLMYECCMHTLRVYLMRMGWVGEAGQVVYEPIPGVASTLKCRGQVLASTRKVTYQLTLKALGYEADGTPFCLADALMLADGKPIVHIKDMSVRVSGLKRDQLERLWAGPREERPLYDHASILAFAVGKPSEAFGDRYRPFDHERIIARLPGPPYMFLDRVTEVTGAPWVMQAGAGCVAHYDVPPDAWYFREEGQPTMPFAVLLEAGLQPCGWLAAYVGSALTSDVDMSFRNLGGEGVQHRLVTPDTGTLTTRVTLTKVSQSGGMVIQDYAFEVTCPAGPVYTATTTFGFFTKAALAQQVGVRGARPHVPATAGIPLPPGQVAEPGRMLKMFDTLDVYEPAGGQFGLGFVSGTKQVDPREWFFAAHFYQDPVCPGSLGLESMLQLMKRVAGHHFGGGTLEVMALDTSHGWQYRGQIVPTNRQVTVEAHVKRVDPATRTITADGLLCVDGLPIYTMRDFAVRVR